MRKAILPGFSRYDIFEDGTIFSRTSKKHQRFLKCSFNPAGYRTVTLRCDNCPKHHIHSFFVHRIVAECFLVNPLDTSYQVNHIDGDKSNNHYSNLEWLSPSQNIQHAIQNGLLKIGTKSKASKLTDKSLILLLLRMEALIKIGRSKGKIKYFNLKSLAAEFGISQGRISQLYIKHFKDYALVYAKEDPTRESVSSQSDEKVKNAQGHLVL